MLGKRKRPEKAFIQPTEAEAKLAEKLEIIIDEQYDHYYKTIDSLNELADATLFLEGDNFHVDRSDNHYLFRIQGNQLQMFRFPSANYDPRRPVVKAVDYILVVFSVNQESMKRQVYSISEIDPKATNPTRNFLPDENDEMFLAWSAQLKITRFAQAFQEMVHGSR